MKILFVYSSLAEKGPTKQLLYLACHLRSLGYDARVLTLSPEGATSIARQFDEQKIPWSSLGLSRLKGLVLAKSALRGFLQREKFDLVHTHGLRPDALVASLQIDVPHLVTIRNVPWVDYPMKFGPVLGRLMSWRHLQVLRKCRLNVACSQSIHEGLVSVLPGLCFIRNGVKVPPPQDKESLRKKLGLGTDDKVVVWVGSLIPRKNLPDFFGAVNLLAKRDNLRFVVLGEGPERSRIPGDARILHPGHVGNIHEWLFASDVFVSTSLSEGLPNAVLEAIACGLPTILSDIPAHREINEMGYGAQFYKLGDVADLAEKIAGAAAAPLAKVDLSSISAERMANDYLKLYQSVLEGPRP
jgi:glycosyltransferase involved in cell wall biosynthesis